MRCFGTGCHIRRGVAELAKQVATRGASSAGITSTWPSRSRTDNDRGMPPHPRLDGKRAAGEMRRGRRRGLRLYRWGLCCLSLSLLKFAAGVGGDCGRIGGERVGYSVSADLFSFPFWE